MIAVKIECGCGQRFAFDVEPVNGQMASSVACPACGADGTVAANEIIAGSLTPSPPPVSADAPITLSSKHTRLKIAAAERPVQPAASKITADPRSLGIVDRNQAEHEARAKISWGDSPEAVISFLMIQGFGAQEASDLVAALFKERMAAVRANGIRKIALGGGMMCVPVIAYITFAQIGVIPIKLMGIAMAVGLWGGWIVINGIIMLVVPKMESGDVAEQ